MLKLLHRTETVYVVFMLAMVLWGILGSTREVIHFSVLWMLVCVGCAIAALRPGTSRGVAIVAEIVLLVVAVGQWVGPRHDLLPMLGREMPNWPKWNLLDLTERRILAWNIIAAFSLTWLTLACVILISLFRNKRRDSLLARIGYFAGFGLAWSGLGLVFFLLVREFLF